MPLSRAAISEPKGLVDQSSPEDIREPGSTHSPTLKRRRPSNLKLQTHPQPLVPGSSHPNGKTQLKIRCFGGNHDARP
jgi:hypothetical protein